MKRMKMFKSTKLLEKEKEVEELSELLSTKEKELKEMRGDNILVKCETLRKDEGCGKYTPIGDLIYIQTYWYTPPYGCTGGDYWNMGEGRFQCPHCGAENRLIYEREEYCNYKYDFKMIDKVYER